MQYIFILLLLIALIIWLWIEVYIAWKRAIEDIRADIAELKALEKDIKDFINKS
jgi:hypothetical protein